MPMEARTVNMEKYNALESSDTLQIDSLGSDSGRFSWNKPLATSHLAPA
jgi:hypothetical protein